MTAKKILDEALSVIKPKTRNIKEVDELIKNINSQIRKKKVSAKAVIGGSFAKDTFLKEDHDVDIFVMFNLKHKKEDLSILLKKILKPFKTDQVHGSRDYFVIKNAFNFEIVPVLDIKKSGNAQNVTDFSPEHVKWFNKNGKKYRDEVRIAKKFCKANKIYGAESYINGFSGHVLDILIINYKGFIPLLRASAKWKKKQVIDFYKIHKGNALFNLNKSKTQGNLIVVDPVQPDRNAAAALADEKLALFVNSAKKFLKRPSKRFFTEEKADKEKLKSKGYVIIEVISKKGKNDVVGAKLLKAFGFVKKGLKDFEIKTADWEWNQKKAFFWYLTKNKKLAETIEWPGPPLMMEKSVKDFKKKYRKTFTKKGRIFAKVKRKHTTPDSIVNDLIKNKYFKERVKKCRKL